MAKQTDKLQEAKELLMQDIKQREQQAMEDVQKALSEIQEKYKVSIIITQPQLIVKSN
jgi:thiamine pyrophosphokinase